MEIIKFDCLFDFQGLLAAVTVKDAVLTLYTLNEIAALDDVNVGFVFNGYLNNRIALSDFFFSAGMGDFDFYENWVSALIALQKNVRPKLVNILFFFDGLIELG